MCSISCACHCVTGLAQIILMTMITIIRAYSEFYYVPQGPVIMLKVAILLGVFSSNAVGKVVCQLNII